MTQLPDTKTSDITNAKAANRGRSRLTLVLLAGIFFAPVLIALALQTPWFHYSAPPTKNFGTLITPVQPTGAWLSAPSQLAKEVLGEAPWTLLLIHRGSCADACLLKAQEMNAIKQVQNRNINRVKLQLVSTETAPALNTAQWTTYQLANEQFNALIQALAVGDQSLVMLDPLGNAMMHYPANFDGTGVRKDLARMLKISQAGRTTPN
jgi:hypothetical protein